MIFLEFSEITPQRGSIFVAHHSHENSLDSCIPCTLSGITFLIGASLQSIRAHTLTHLARYGPDFTVPQMTDPTATVDVTPPNVMLDARLFPFELQTVHHYTRRPSVPAASQGT